MDLLKNVSNFGTQLEKIESQLFDVVKLQYPAPMEGFNQPNAYGIYKGNGGQELGTVGKKYEAIQPKQFLGAFINGIIESGINVDLSKLQYRQYGNGERISFDLPLKTIAFKNLAKVGDEVETNLSFTTTFNGSGATRIGLFTKRLICTNGMTVTEKTATKGYKHFENSNNKALVHANDIGKVATLGIDKLAEFIKALNKKEVTQKDINRVLTLIVGHDFNKQKELSTRIQNTMNKINNSVALEISRSGGNLWGVLNGITHYTNHVASINGQGVSKNKDFAYVKFGAGATLNKKAENILFAELAN